MPSKRATDAEKNQRYSFIHRLLDLGISRGAILAQVMKRFEISRAQAYKDLAYVADDRQQEAIQIAPPRGTDALQEVIGILHTAMIDAVVDGDTKELPKLSKELRETCKSLGIGAALGDAQPHGADAVGQVDPPMAVVAASASLKAEMAADTSVAPPAEPGSKVHEKRQMNEIVHASDRQIADEKKKSR